ncbi:conserved hypothetical protein [Aspergillus terreus NIH2624]|uniref:Methionine permease n=1 Tax=Aspergillus terreus (strain NIH 2624 / FGSC A1156) TaxID=341663 RepID=Q0CRY8_ASPTN|nr:uncharacterized protein ATEG_03546 [Aspergillus terreus NIH2624]EAU36820.1 conserved hypothetical protein [Aspergillus terreus NIH2624]
MVYMEQQPLLGNRPTEYDTLRRASIPQVPNLPREQSLSWTSSYILVVSRVIGSGIFATPGSIYTLFALCDDPTDRQQIYLAVGLLTFITIIHGVFPRTGIWIQNLLGWTKIAVVTAMSVTGLWVILFRHNYSGVSQDNLTAFSYDRIWEGSKWSWSLLSTSLFKVLYSYAGLNNVNNVLGEVQDPVRTLKTVAPVAMLTASALYLVANISYFLVIPLDQIKESGELVGALLFERVLGPHVGRVIFPIAIAISAAGNVMVVTFALEQARVNQEIARQGFLPWPRILSSSAPFGAPLGGLLVHYVPSILVIALPPQGDVYNFILDVEGYPGQLFALASTVGLIILRRREPLRPRPFRAWLPAVYLRILICLALLTAPFVPPADRKGDVHFFYATYAIVGMGVVVFGVAYWYVWTVLLPQMGGYKLDEKDDVLNDGTRITKLVRVYGSDDAGVAPAHVVD